MFNLCPTASWPIMVCGFWKFIRRFIGLNIVGVWMILIFNFWSAIIVPFFPSFSPYTRQQFILNHNRDFPTHGLHRWTLCHHDYVTSKVTENKAGGLYLHCHFGGGLPKAAAVLHNITPDNITSDPCSSKEFPCKRNKNEIRRRIRELFSDTGAHATRKRWY